MRYMLWWCFSVQCLNITVTELLFRMRWQWLDDLELGTWFCSAELPAVCCFPCCVINYQIRKIFCGLVTARYKVIEIVMGLWFVWHQALALFCVQCRLVPSSMQGGQTSLKGLEKKYPFLQDWESPWNRALKVLEFGVKGPWVSVFHNHHCCDVKLVHSVLNTGQRAIVYRIPKTCYVTAVFNTTFMLFLIFIWCHNGKTSLE